MTIILSALIFAEIATTVPAPPAEPKAVQPTIVVTDQHFHDPLKDDSAQEAMVSENTVVYHKNFQTGSRLNVSTTCLTKRH